jgi:hypothetical protein
MWFFAAAWSAACGPTSAAPIGTVEPQPGPDDPQPGIQPSGGDPQAAGEASGQGGDPNPSQAGGECTTDAECRLATVNSCEEILSCSSSCPGVGQLVALSEAEPDPVPPFCGPQPPCTPACPVWPSDSRPPRVACQAGRCVLVE